jgi:hypothetical protein
MTQRWITKKGKNGDNRHIPINEGNKIREKEIKPQNITEDKNFKTIESFSVDGDSYMDALSKILFGKYKNILFNSKPIGARYYVYKERVKDSSDIEKAGHGSFVYAMSKGRKKYALIGTVTKKGNKWHMDAELSEYIG